MTVVEDIAAERQRQIEVEGWTPEHDDEHASGEMSRAAACYLLFNVASIHEETEPRLLGRLWPWAGHRWKPKSLRRDLVRAGALIVAEIERLDRAALKGPPE